MTTENKMEYVNLGRSGLRVSRLSYGNWVNSKGGQSDVIDECVKYCYDHGVNYFDTAEIYDMGDGERQMAHAIRKLNIPRDELVIATKLYWGQRSDTVIGANTKGCSRKHLMEGMKRSLDLLEMDYVDLVFLHRYDEHTPIRETLLAVKEILESGRVHYWGTSEWPAVRIMQAMHMCDELQMPRPIAEQCEYSMLHRQKMESDYGCLFDDYGYGTTIFSPLKSGVLTGKYNNGIPEGSRFAENKDLKGIYNSCFGEDVKEKTLKMFNELDAIAKEFGMTMGQLALAWTIAYDNTSSCILGASKVEQIKENMQALELSKKLTPEVLKRINETLNNAPTAERNFRQGGQIPLRR